MTDTDDPDGPTGRYQAAVARLEQPLGALAEAMDDIEATAAQKADSHYLGQLVAERIKWREVKLLTHPEQVFAATLASAGARQRLLQLLAPSLVFPTEAPMMADRSGAALRAARAGAELHKENLRKMIVAEVNRIEAAGAA